ncbi:MAG: glycosyltransferase family 2 protein [Saprospiraceae bacterium]|nr:glycosyltransferase family 2 protein [Saprospiraceae bacterium]
MIDISIVIPIYNEEANIQLLYDRLSGVLGEMGKSYELMFVNDGSKDRSLALIKDLASKYPEVRYLDFSRNFGHQIAVTAGLDRVEGEAVVIIDADLQDPPELIPDMYARMKDGFEVVYARRKSRKGESWFKRATAKWFYRVLARITSVEIPVDTGDFRIMDRKILDVLKQMPEKNKYLRGQIAWIGFRQTYIEYERQERHAGETGYTFRKMLRFALDGITGFSDFPLKIVTYFGFLVTAFAFFVAIYVLYSRFVSGNYVQGWSSLMISLLFIGGVQMIAIGIIGEYLSRMNTNVRNRPLYIIRETNVDRE